MNSLDKSLLELTAQCSLEYCAMLQQVHICVYCKRYIEGVWNMSTLRKPATFMNVNLYSYKCTNKPLSHLYKENIIGMTTRRIFHHSSTMRRLYCVVKEKGMTFGLSLCWCC